MVNAMVLTLQISTWMNPAHVYPYPHLITAEHDIIHMLSYEISMVNKLDTHIYV